MTDKAFTIPIELVAFAILMLLAFAWTADLYGALFPSDDTVYELADQLEYLACAGGFGTLEDSTENGCNASERYARTVRVIDANDDGAQRIILFEAQDQTIFEYVQQGSSTTSSSPWSGGGVGTMQETTRQYTNPLESPAVCKLPEYEELQPRHCAPLQLPQGVRISTIPTNVDSDSPPRTYTNLYSDAQTYAAPVLSPAIPAHPDHVTPRRVFYLYLEYTPEPPRILATTTTDDMLEREPATIN